MTLHYQESDPVILGSGELYLALASDITDPENVTEEEEAKFVNIGLIESGANIDIANTYQTIYSANRGLVKKFKVNSEVKFSTGVMTWNMENISKFLTGSKFEDDPATGTRKMIIGENDNLPTVYLRFIHKKKDGSGELIVNMYKAQFDGDLSFVFSKENAITINYEFVAMTNDKNNYVEFIETYPPVEE